jgi:hypothetical protein
MQATNNIRNGLIKQRDLKSNPYPLSLSFYRCDPLEENIEPKAAEIQVLLDLQHQQLNYTEKESVSRLLL